LGPVDSSLSFALSNDRRRMKEERKQDIKNDGKERMKE
jgi:hypothetical protein